MPPKVPKWRQIADEIAGQIADGVYSPGDQLPHIRKLVDEGKGSTATVHRAYQALEAEGLVSSSRGHGTRVRAATDAPHTAVTGAGRLRRLSRTGRPYAPREVAVNRRAMLRSCADPKVADELGIELYDEIVIRSRTFVSDGKPTILALNYIHPRALGALPELLDAGPMEKFRHELYQERTGRAVTADPERRGARLASTNELSEFGIDVPPDVAVPVLVLRTLFRDQEGPLELWEDIYRPGMEQVDQGSG
ncbi:GntR family transcriptional regulator [Streptomyces sp. NPDC058914]|uniref:GntR family transcriptional regulator n=1 Tax=Streptomyces sp. NPDC058914 TaxID=3346671 RepID=UPI0036780FEB